MIFCARYLIQVEEETIMCNCKLYELMSADGLLPEVDALFKKDFIICPLLMDMQMINDSKGCAIC